jgi:hypothetical protein
MESLNTEVKDSDPVQKNEHDVIANHVPANQNEASPSPAVPASEPAKQQGAILWIFDCLGFDWSIFGGYVETAKETESNESHPPINIHELVFPALI